MKTIRRTEQIINKKETDEGIENVDTRVALIQALIPIRRSLSGRLPHQIITERRYSQPLQFPFQRYEHRFLLWLSESAPLSPASFVSHP